MRHQNRGFSGDNEGVEPHELHEQEVFKNKANEIETPIKNHRRLGYFSRIISLIACVIFVSLVVVLRTLPLSSSRHLTPTLTIATMTAISPFRVSGKLSGTIILSLSEIVLGHVTPYIYTVGAVNGIKTRLSIDEYATHSATYYGGDVQVAYSWGTSQLLAWSPDRRFRAYRILFAGRYDDTITVIDNLTHKSTRGTVTSNLPPTIDCTSTSGFMWSPDGQYIAYTASYAKFYDNGQRCVSVGAGVYIEELSTGISSRIASTEQSSDASFVWSPDSTFLLVQFGGLTKWKKTKDRWQAEPLPDRVDLFSISSDSTRIVYTTPLFTKPGGGLVRGRECLKAASANGFTLSTLKCLDDDLGFKALAISPDGKYIAGLVGQFFEKIYVGRQYGRLIVMDIDGSHFTEFPMGGNSLVWSPNSSYLAVFSERTISLIGIDGCCATIIAAPIRDPYGVILGWEDWEEF